MAYLDLLIFIVALVLVRELRRVFGRKRRDGDDSASEGDSKSSIHRYIRGLQAKRDGFSGGAEVAPPRGAAPSVGAGAEADTTFAEVSAEAGAQGNAEVSAEVSAPVSDRERGVASAGDTDGTDGTGVPDKTAVVFARIKSADPSFSCEDFLKGARHAYEEVVEGFADNDYERLDSLLDEPARNAFFSAMRRRRGETQWRADHLVNIFSAAARSATIEGGIAKITVRFVSEQFEALRSARYDPRQAHVDPSALATVTHDWTFRRALRSHDPNWTLAETRNVIDGGGIAAPETSAT